MSSILDRRRLIIGITFSLLPRYHELHFNTWKIQHLKRSKREKLEEAKRTIFSIFIAKSTKTNYEDWKVWAFIPLWYLRKSHRDTNSPTSCWTHCRCIIFTRGTHLYHHNQQSEPVRSCKKKISIFKISHLNLNTDQQHSYQSSLTIAYRAGKERTTEEIMNSCFWTGKAENTAGVNPAKHVNAAPRTYTM